MKKIYILSLVSLLGFQLNAQQKLNAGTHKRIAKETDAAAKSINPGNNLMTITGSIVCTNGYVAGTTMNLNFTINTTNTDGEFIDSLAITFPAGFTIIGTSATPTFPTADNGGGDEAYNGINGQTITWGTNVGNTDYYGGIWASPSQNFSINVSVGAGLTGPQTLTYFAKGDSFPGTLTTPGPCGDLIGNIVVNPAVPNDLMAIASFIPGGCGLSNAETVELMFMNNGTAAQSNFPLAYSANGGAAVVETYTATVNPGDTIIYAFTTPLDMSVEGIYDLTAFTDLNTDSNHNNDTSLYTDASVVSHLPPYSTSFENNPLTDLLGWTTLDADGSGMTWALNPAAHTGTQSLRAYEGAVNGASDDWLFSRCLDFDAANTYKITFWRRLTNAYSGGLGIAYNNVQDIAGATYLYPVTNYTNTGVWSKDSATFTVSATGTYYLGFEAVNSDTNNSIALRLDDIDIVDLGPTTGINNNISIAAALFPNPSTGTLFVTLNENNARIEVYNMVGELAYSKNNLMKGQNTIDLHQLSNGTYTVKVYSRTETAVRKITISK